MQHIVVDGTVVMGLFQSSSGQKAGCNTVRTGQITIDILFQSSSGQKAGCNACI